MNRPFRRLLTGFGLLLVVGLLALTATTNVFAFASTQSSATNAGPLNISGAVVPSAITPGGAATYTANYSFTLASAPASLTPSAQATTIGTMYQQWRHNTDTTRWFYLFAVNQQQGAAASPAAGVTGAAPSNLSDASFAFYFYTKEAGMTLFSSQGAGSVGLGTLATAQAGVTPIVNIKTSFPAATVLNMSANVTACAGAAGTRCIATLETSVRWGLAQEAWMGGSATLLQAVESVPLTQGAVAASGVPAAPGAAGASTFGDSWNMPVTLTLTNVAPTQSATGVTNLGTVAAPAARQTGINYSLAQTVADADSDLQTGSLVFMFTAGTQTGQWFQVGYTNGDNNDNTINIAQANATCWYQSWNESVITAQGCSPLTGNYVTSYSASATGSAASETVTHTVMFSALSRGTVSVFGRGDDLHGGSSGNVLVGALTIS